MTKGSISLAYAIAQFWVPSMAALGDAMTRSIARTIYLAATWLLVVGAVVQIFLAGLGVFDDPSAFITHRDFGFMLELLPIVMMVAAIVARMGRMYIGGAVLLFVQFMLQSVLVALRTDLPAVAALHPLNGVLMLLVALILGRAAWRDRQAQAESAASTGG